MREPDEDGAIDAAWLTEQIPVYWLQSDASASSGWHSGSGSSAEPH